MASTPSVTPDRAAILEGLADLLIDAFEAGVRPWPEANDDVWEAAAARWAGGEVDWAEALKGSKRG